MMKHIWPFLEYPCRKFHLDLHSRFVRMKNTNIHVYSVIIIFANSKISYYKKAIKFKKSRKCVKTTKKNGIVPRKQKGQETSSRTYTSNPRSPGRTINIFHEIHDRHRRIQTALNQAIIGVTSKYYNQGIRTQRCY